MIAARGGTKLFNTGKLGRSRSEETAARRRAGTKDDELILSFGTYPRYMPPSTVSTNATFKRTRFPQNLYFAKRYALTSHRQRDRRKLQYTRSKRQRRIQLDTAGVMQPADLTGQAALGPGSETHDLEPNLWFRSEPTVDCSPKNDRRPATSGSTVCPDAVPAPKPNPSPTPDLGRLLGFSSSSTVCPDAVPAPNPNPSPTPDFDLLLR
ncbi:hypothetical protein EVAR_39693_1 [Eumeta japonica]|uniref:Uncharacterized protein n=1 Tax=Eumeta variegata TaxID=151549 RepID=A0A4C1W460_EUMVA|nr:hypothetical protein EVAR_39693_1 [Eumeta japonica]